MKGFAADENLRRSCAQKSDISALVGARTTHEVGYLNKTLFIKKTLYFYQIFTLLYSIFYVYLGGGGSLAGGGGDADRSHLSHNRPKIASQSLPAPIH